MTRSLTVRFYPGLHQPADAQHFALACISINRLRGRRKTVACDEVLVDSGAFTELEGHGKYRHGVETYAAELHRLYTTGVVRIAAAVAQDYMCEPFTLAKTGMTTVDHQRLTIERYDALVVVLQRLFFGTCPFPVMPVLQGYSPADYVRHLNAYGTRLAPNMWVGVGSVCKRQGDPRAIVEVLQSIIRERPDLRLHGFGVKTQALEHAGVRHMLFSADSMAWSFGAAQRSGLLVRRLGRELGRRVKPKEARGILAQRGVEVPDANDWREAQAFADRINAWRSLGDAGWQMELFAA